LRAGFAIELPLEPVMLDVAIVGGGICGLALGRELAANGTSFALFEARERLGGRVLSVQNMTSGLRLDLGPSWFWPETQAAVVQLASELGLTSFDQYDPGSALLLADTEEPPETRTTSRLHAGARRFEGGMASLVESLAASLPTEAIHLGCALREARDCGDHVELMFDIGGGRSAVNARRVVLATPPRLLAENMRFEPALPMATNAVMSATPTWMAAQAKAVIGFAGEPAWRVAGHSGNAFVVHDQAVLGEVFDACDASGAKAALGGFFALSAELREAFRGGLPMLVASQFVQLFGKEVEAGELQMQDWSKEEFTCARADLKASTAHPDYGLWALRQPLWRGKLFLGGTETAREGGGYVEGAINAAARIGKQLCKEEGDSVMTKAPDLASPDLVNQRSLEFFAEWVKSRRAPTFASYRQRLTYALSHGQKEQITQRAMLGAMEAVFKDALAMIGELPFNHDGVAVERGRSDLTPKIQAGFEGFIQELLDSVVAFNQTSCALSNFPEEHRLAKDYISTTLRDIGAAWREFSLEANRLLLEKRAAPAMTES
jgi:monoamine oxidase